MSDLDAVMHDINWYFIDKIHITLEHSILEGLKPFIQRYGEQCARHPQFDDVSVNCACCAKLTSCFPAGKGHRLENYPECYIDWQHPKEG